MPRSGGTKSPARRRRARDRSRNSRGKGKRVGGQKRRRASRTATRRSRDVCYGKSKYKDQFDTCDTIESVNTDKKKDDVAKEAITNICLFIKKCKSKHDLNDLRDFKKQIKAKLNAKKWEIQGDSYIPPDTPIRDAVKIWSRRALFPTLLQSQKQSTTTTQSSKQQRVSL